MREFLRNPHDPATFDACKLDHAERDKNRHVWELHRDLLTLRREDPVIAAQRARGLDGAVLGPGAFVLRYFGEEHGDRLLIVNFGRDFVASPCPEPLLAPPRGRKWKLLWSSEDPAYGGDGTPKMDEGAWSIPGHASLVFTVERASRPTPLLPGQNGGD